MKKTIRYIMGLPVIIAVLFATGTLYFGSKTLSELLGENKRLKKAISTLTEESQIGYAKVIDQQERDGTIYTTIRFVETARDNKLETVLEKEVEIEGENIHFDALIVTFSGEAIMGGKERSLYLWRRIYGENQPPAEGFPIEEVGAEPARYNGLLSRLRIYERDMFWKAVWDLSNDPQSLQDYGIKAVYGNAVYKELKPGLIFVFKISPTGQIFLETVPDL